MLMAFLATALPAQEKPESNVTASTNDDANAGSEKREPRLRPNDDKEFDKGSGIKRVAVTKQSIAALELLGRVWGFVKYHHPTVTEGKVNWDYELFRVLPKYIAAKSTEKQSEILLGWIKSLGEYESLAKAPNFDETHTLTPNYKWLDKVESSALADELNALRAAKRTWNNFYAGILLSHKPFNEQAYPQFDYPDAGFRLLSVYRFWNIIQYYSPYRNLTDKDWDAVLAEYIPRFLNAKDGLGYRLVAMELICELHDTHASIRGPDKIISEFRGTKIAPLQLRFVEGKLVVSGYIEKFAVDENELRIGDIVTTIDGVSVRDWVQTKGRYFCASNEAAKMRIIAQSILRTNGDRLALTLDRNGKELPVEVACFDRSDVGKAAAAQHLKRQPWKVLDAGVAYLYTGTLTKEDNQKEQFSKELDGKKALVVDLRCYPSQTIVLTLGNQLVSKRTVFAKFTTPNLTTPGSFEFSYDAKIGSWGLFNKQEAFPGKVAILVDENSQSQAEFTAMAFRVAPQTRVFGSTTAGADGDIRGLNLPGDIKTRISAKGVYTPDGKDTQRVGIIPDARVTPTIEGIKSGRDEVLEAAIDWINDGDN